MEKKSTPNGLKLCTILGIPVYLNITMVLPIIVFPILMLPDLYEAGMTLLKFIVLYTVVLTHEMAHATMAKLFGLKVHSITLLLLGGVCRSEIPFGRPMANLLIAVAGPFVNMVLVTVFLAVEVARGTTMVPSMDIHSYNLNDLVVYMIVFNATMLIFNLLPIFPMDGGRIFQAFLHLTIGRRKAVKVAAIVSLVLIASAIVFCLVTKNYYYLLFAPMLAIANVQESKANLEHLDQEEFENWVRAGAPTIYDNRK